MVVIQRHSNDGNVFESLFHRKKRTESYRTWQLGRLLEVSCLNFSSLYGWKTKDYNFTPNGRQSWDWYMCLQSLNLVLFPGHFGIRRMLIKWGTSEKRWRNIKGGNVRGVQGRKKWNKQAVLIIKSERGHPKPQESSGLMQRRVVHQQTVVVAKEMTQVFMYQ